MVGTVVALPKVHPQGCGAAPFAPTGRRSIIPYHSALGCAPAFTASPSTLVPWIHLRAYILCKASIDDDANRKKNLDAADTATPTEDQHRRQPNGGTSHLPLPLLRKASAASDALQALDILAEELGPGVQLGEAECRAIMAAAVERGNTDLARSIFAAMTQAAAGASVSAPASLLSFDAVASQPSPNGSYSAVSQRVAWPGASAETAAALVICLCRALRSKEAVAVLQSLRSRGLPSATEDVHFGHVVNGLGGLPLAVVQPQEGVKAIADANTRYEYELFSGTVIETSSDSLISETGGGLVSALARATGLFRKPLAGAVHTAIVQTPSGQQRTFRFGTETADLPSKRGDRVTLVCAPQTPVLSRSRLLPSTPPNAKPGEPLLLSNHSTRASVLLLRPPVADAGSVPSWVVPAVALLVASDAASSLVDPVLPWLLAGAVATTAATGIAGTRIVLPRLKQLPERAVSVQAMRQQLLTQYASLDARMRQLVAECEDDVRSLARLWQLLAKMGAVAAGGGIAAVLASSSRDEDLADGVVSASVSSSPAAGNSAGSPPTTAGSGVYDARQERVAAACGALESRLRKRIELVERYAAVMSMIEIEVEMETEVPAAEVAGIEAAVVALKEAEDIATMWVEQAAAADEVERLLKGA